MPSKNRRQFIKESLEAGAVAGLTALAAGAANAQTAQSSDQVAGANDRLRVALIGCGGMGRNDLRQMLKIKNVECVALCDVDDTQAAQVQKMGETDNGQHPQPGT